MIIEWKAKLFMGKTMFAGSASIYVYRYIYRYIICIYVFDIFIIFISKYIYVKYFRKYIYACG